MKRYCASVLMLVGLVAGIACGGRPDSSSDAEIVVFAAASLTDAITAIADRFTEETGVVVLTNVASSSTLQRQIELGAPADVFVSASPTQMDALAEQGLLMEDTRCDVLTNRLVLIAPRGGEIEFTSFEDVLTRAARVAIGEPTSVPAGVYAKEALTSLGLWDAVQSKLTPASNVRSALSYVESGEIDVGIVYETDAAHSENVKTLAVFPESTDARIVYPAAVVRDARNEPAARRFVERLSGDESRAIFAQFGFTPIR